MKGRRGKVVARNYRDFLFKLGMPFPCPEVWEKESADREKLKIEGKRE